MHDHMELDRQHLLTVIETAHREGKTESEIVELVDPSFARETAKLERGSLLGRLIRRSEAREAA
jgi:hypothetical protein